MLGEGTFEGYYCSRKFLRIEEFNVPYWHFRMNGTFRYYNSNNRYCRIEGMWQFYDKFISLEGGKFMDMVHVKTD